MRLTLHSKPVMHIPVGIASITFRSKLPVNIPTAALIARLFAWFNWISPHSLARAWFDLSCDGFASLAALRGRVAFRLV